MSECRFGFIGVGNMASAIITSILKLDYIKPQLLFVFDPATDKTSHLKSKGVNVCENAKDVVNFADFIFLCVKPQLFIDVASEISQFVSTKKCIVSIMAGVKIETIKGAFNNNPHVIRIMPNTPLMLGEGASGLCRCEKTTDTEFEIIFDIFSNCGKAIVVDEDDISTVTALSGSGPAYFFKFARAMIDEGIELGLSYEDCLALVCQTMRGSAEMLEKSGKTADDLIKMVTSPNGTTHAANVSFDANSFEPIVKEAVKACYDRAVELSEN